MNTLNRELQYQQCDGEWKNCGDRTDEFLADCVRCDYRHYTMEQVIDHLNAGETVDNGSNWYDKCRTIPVPVKYAPVKQGWIPDNEDYGY